MLENIVNKYTSKWNKIDPLKIPELLNWRLGEETAWKVKPTGERPDK